MNDTFLKPGDLKGRRKQVARQERHKNLRTKDFI